MNNTALQVDENESLASRADEALQQLLYSAHAFSAVAVPVAISMILSSLAVVFINDGLNGKTRGGTGIPVVFQETGAETNDQRFVNALVNALAIVGAIIGATFIMVLLYYFKFMRLLIGWLISSTALLLAFSTGLLVQTGLTLGNVPVDAISYAFIFYNFAIVGVTAVFYQKGIPSRITGGYLVVISVTMAWILLRYLPEWTCWALLGVLAFYDLCAVLTPCGPLKWLVGIMQERDEPLPGLLYEARIRQANNNGNDFAATNEQVGMLGAAGQSAATANAPRYPSTNQETAHLVDVESQLPPEKPAKTLSLSSAPPMAAYQMTSETGGSRAPTSSESDLAPDRAASSTSSSSNQLSTPATRPAASNGGAVRPASASAALAEIRPQSTAAQQQQQQPQPHSVPQGDYVDDGLEDPDRTIKLGLGDFVFYSLLCARAALVSFTTFISVFVVVLFGLAMTLVLLAVYRAALPALPISILLGLVFYFAVDAVVVPFVTDFGAQMAYS